MMNNNREEEGSEKDREKSQSQESRASSRQGGTNSRQRGTISKQDITTPRQGGGVSTMTVKPAPYQFADPCPQSMRHVRIADLSSVDINWKMLTLARPNTMIDEDIFSKYFKISFQNTAKCCQTCRAGQAPPDDQERRSQGPSKCGQC